MAVAVVTVASFLWVVLATAWSIGNRHGDDVDRLVAQGQLILGAFTFVATVVLAVTTIYYAWATRQMVLEMQSARQQSVRPHLALDLEMVSPTAAMVRVTNGGGGPALDAKLDVTFHARAGAGAAEDRRTFRMVFVPAGGHFELLPPDAGGMNLMSTQQLADRYERITMAGTVSTTLGQRMPVSDSIDDLAEWRAQSAQAHVRFQHPELAEVRRELEKTRKAVEQIVRVADRALDRRGETHPDSGSETRPPRRTPGSFWRRFRSPG